MIYRSKPNLNTQLSIFWIMHKQYQIGENRKSWFQICLAKLRTENTRESCSRTHNWTNVLTTHSLTHSVNHSLVLYSLTRAFGTRAAVIPRAFSSPRFCAGSTRWFAYGWTALRWLRFWRRFYIEKLENPCINKEFWGIENLVASFALNQTCSLTQLNRELPMRSNLCRITQCIT